MDASTSLLLSSPHNMDKSHYSSGSGGGAPAVLYDSTLLQRQAKIPKEFIWPHSDRLLSRHTLRAPVVDLQGFLQAGDDETAIRRAAEAVRAACLSHGFFQVVNHGVEPAVSKGALDGGGKFFELPLATKLRARRRPGSTWGYVAAHADRFASKLPWKETFSFGYDFRDAGDGAVVDYFRSNFGEDFEQFGWMCQRYSAAMKRLSLSLMELLAMSLGVGRQEYREFFEDGSAIVRCNYYPPCPEPELALGTGPHCDPTALTVLQQDEVGGLEVFAEGKWQSVGPLDGALVVNIGDTFMALSNGRYKSCLHRAVVNRQCARRSLAFFLCPRGDKLLRPPETLLLPPMSMPSPLAPGGHAASAVAPASCRAYPDFTWSELLEFTQSRYRADGSTLQTFASHVLRLTTSTSTITSTPMP